MGKKKKSKREPTGRPIDDGELSSPVDRDWAKVDSTAEPGVAINELRESDVENEE